MKITLKPEYLITEAQALKALPPLPPTTDRIRWLRCQVKPYTTDDGPVLYPADTIKELAAKLAAVRANDEQTTAGKIGWLFLDAHCGIITDKEFQQQAEVAAQSLSFPGLP